MLNVKFHNLSVYRPHKQKDANVRALERFMAAGLPESTLDPIEEEQEKEKSESGSKWTLISDASTKSAPIEKTDDRVFGKDLATTVTKYVKIKSM